MYLMLPPPHTHIRGRYTLMLLTALETHYLNLYSGRPIKFKIIRKTVKNYDNVTIERTVSNLSFEIITMANNKYRNIKNGPE